MTVNRIFGTIALLLLGAVAVKRIFDLAVWSVLFRWLLFAYVGLICVAGMWFLIAIRAPAGEARGPREVSMWLLPIYLLCSSLLAHCQFHTVRSCVQYLRHKYAQNLGHCCLVSTTIAILRALRFC